MTRSSYRAWCGVIGRVLPKPAALMREALSETLPVRIATGEIRAYLPVSSDEGMAAGSGTSLPLPPITADCHRLLPAIIVAWDLTRVWRQRYQIMVVQALTEQIPEPIVFWFVIFGFVAKCVIHCIWDYYMYGSLRLYVRRNARFFHLYENLKLQDRLISLTH